MHSAIYDSYCSVVMLHRSMGQLEERVGSVCIMYMCILLYMKHMQCSGVA